MATEGKREGKVEEVEFTGKRRGKTSVINGSAGLKVKKVGKRTTQEENIRNTGRGAAPIAAWKGERLVLYITKKY